MKNKLYDIAFILQKHFDDVVIKPGDGTCMFLLYIDNSMYPYHFMTRQLLEMQTYDVVNSIWEIFIRENF
jgi:hypothetical protein